MAPVTEAFYSVRGVLLTLPWLLWLFITDVAISLLLPLKAFFPDFTYDASSIGAFTVWRWIQFLFETVNGAEITVSGDALPHGESAVVVANHVTWPDFYMIQKMAIGAGMLGRCRYFAKIQLRSVPFLGWGLWAMGMPMVSRNWLKDKRELDRVFSGIVDRRWPTWLISFSEATRFTPQKYAESLAWCESQGKPQPQHLLYPRTRGFIATVQHLRAAPHVKAVYDFTIAYQDVGTGRFQSAPSMWDSLRLPGLSARGGKGVETKTGKGAAGHRFHVHARRFPMEDLPRDDDGLAAWLEARWVEKGRWLESKRVEWAGEAAVATK